MKIGDKIICVQQNGPNYRGDLEDDERLIIGESYIITDIDIHFPNRICVQLKGPYYFHQEWIPVDCFSDIQSIRDFKINQILS
jgi:hypothetical protein